MTYQPGDTYYGQFTTTHPASQACVDADALPVGTVTRNGVDDGEVTVTVTKLDTGRYKATCVIPVTYALGDVVHISVAATVSGISAKGVLDALRLASPSDVSGLLDEALSGHTTAGTVGAALGHIGTSTITVVSPVGDGGTLTLYRGDTYTDTRVLGFTIEDYSGPDLDGVAGTFRMLARSTHLGSTASADLEVACTYAQTGTTVTVDVTLTAEDTGSLAASPPKGALNYHYQLRATPTDKAITVAEGDATVRKVYT